MYPPFPWSARCTRRTRWLPSSAVRPRDLDGVPLISFGSDTLFGQLLDEAFARDGRERRVSIELIIGVQAAPLVHRNAGVALVDGYMRSAGLPASPGGLLNPRSYCRSI